MFEQMVYGIEFFRYPGPDLEQLKKDMDFYKKQGFNLIRIQEVWSYEEPIKGIYDFEKIRGILAYAGEIDLDVVITFSLECAPPWLYKHHDVFHRNALREPVAEVTPYPLPSDGKPGPCWDNPIAIEAAENFVGAFIKELGKYEAIKGWAVWQEASMWPIWDTRGQAANSLCHCDFTLEKFRLWLKNKYGTLQNLNQHLMTNYGDWSYIETSRGLGGALMNPLANQFCNFMRERMNDIAAWKKEMVNKFDALKRPVMCHSVFSMLQSGIAPKWDDDYMLAKSMDLYGASLYPKWFGSRESDNQLKYIAFTVDGCRSAVGEKDVWAAELQAGRPGSGLKRWPAPEGREIENWNMMCVARGVKGFVQWQYREEILLGEACGHGLINRRGESVPWLDSLTGLMTFFKKHENIMKQGVVERSGVAIAVNTDSYILAHQAGMDGLAAKAGMNLHGTLLDMNVFTDFIWKEDILLEKLKQYKVVFLPFPVSMSGEYANALKRYVHNGGILISEACPAIYNELSNCTLQSPGFELDEVFGCREKDILEVDFIKEDTGTKEELMLSGEGVLSGTEIQTNHFIQLYTLTGGDEIATWNTDTAGVRNSYGKGRSYVIGTFFGQSATNFDMIKKILAAEGIKSFEKDHPLISRLSSDKGEAMFFYNKKDTETAFEFNIKVGLDYVGHYGGALTENGIRIPAKSSACVVWERF